MKIACTEYFVPNWDSHSLTDEFARRGVFYMGLVAARLPENEAERDEQLSYAISHGMEIDLHAPFGINNIASTDKELRRTSIENVKRSIDLAAKFGIVAVTFHPGRLSSEDDDPEEIWADLMDAVAEIAQYAKEKQVYVGLENMELRPFELVHTVEELNRFAHLGEDNPYFGVTIDFAHYATLGIGLPDLNALKLPIYNVHLSQVLDGKAHHSLTLTEGIVDLPGVCRRLADYGYNGHVLLEIGPPFWESIDILKAANNSI